MEFEKGQSAILLGPDCKPIGEVLIWSINERLYEVVLNHTNKEKEHIWVPEYRLTFCQTK